MRYSDIAEQYSALRAEIDAIPFIGEFTIKDMVFNQVRIQARISAGKCAMYCGHLDSLSGKEYQSMKSPAKQYEAALRAIKMHLKDDNIDMALNALCELRDTLLSHSLALEGALEPYDAQPFKRAA